jgi:hypothetical protein
MRTFLTVLLFIISCAHLTAQRNLRLNSNKQISLFGALGAGNQSLGLSVPLGKSNWNLQAHGNSDVIGLAQSSCPANYFLGGTRTVSIRPKLSVSIGAGVHSTFNFDELYFGLSPLSRVNYQILPWLSLGGSYTQFTNQCESLEGTPSQLFQVSTLVDLKWHRKYKGITTLRSKNPIFIDAFASSGINFSSAGIELSKSKKSHFALRGQLFSKYGGLFPTDLSFADIQWLGMVCKYHLDEITLKAGGGLTTNVFSSDLRSTFSPYFLASVQQKLIPKTYLVLELWQPTFNYFSPSRAPFFQVGLSIELN